MARGTSVGGLGDDRAPSRNAEDAQFVAGFLYQELITARLWWRLKDAVGRAGNGVLGTIHTNPHS